MSLKLLNVVIFAENYDHLVEWYKNTLNLEVTYEEHGEYNYTELGYDKRVVIGITPAKEMDHLPNKPRNNSTIMQLGVSDMKAAFDQIEGNGGKVLFGPTYEENNEFYYGGVADIEGNQIWFTQESEQIPEKKT